MAAAKAQVSQQTLLNLLNSTKLLSLWVRAALKLIQPLLDSLVWVKKTNTPILSDSGIIVKYNLSNVKVARAKELNYG